MTGCADTSSAAWWFRCRHVAMADPSRLCADRSCGMLDGDATHSPMS